VWAVGDVQVTHWDGHAWSAPSPVTTGELAAVWGSGPDDVWTAGDTTVLHRGAAAPPSPDTRVDAPADAGAGPCMNGWCWSWIAPAGAGMHAIWGATPNDIWAVGDGGRIQHFDGARWANAADLAWVGAMTGIWGSGPRDVWAVGDVGAARWDGAAWLGASPCDPPFGVRLAGVWGSGAGDVWAADDTRPAGTAWRFDGRAWSFQTPGKDALDAVWGSGAGDVWLGGDGDTLLHWDGADWSTPAHPALKSIRALGGSGPGDVWALGMDGADHFDGTTWSAVSLPVDEMLNGVWVTAPDDAWAVGTTSVLRWDGTAWTVDATGLGTLNGVWADGAGVVWAVGENGVARRQ
jgi:hypothetical protein